MLEQEDKLFDINGTLEDFLPPIRYVYKSAAFRFFEEFKESVFAFLGKKYEDAKRTFDKGK